MPVDVDKLKYLVDYLDQWQTAHRRYSDWIDGQYERRLADWEKFRGRANDQLLRAVNTLKYVDGRVDPDSRAGAAAKARVLDRANQIYAATVMKGQDLFGITGKRDRGGIFRGGIKPGLSRLTATALENAHAGLDILTPDADELDEHGADLAENIAPNLVHSIRQQHNGLRTAIASRMTQTDVARAVDMDLAPGNARNIEASFKQHLRSAQRELADEYGQDIGAKRWVRLDPGQEPEIIRSAQHQDDAGPTLGRHPHDDSLTVPIPPGYESVARRAIDMLGMTAKERADVLAEYL